MGVEVGMTVAELRRIRDLIHEHEEPCTVEEWEPGDLWVDVDDRRGVLLHIGKAGMGGVPWIVLCRWPSHQDGRLELFAATPTMVENAHQMQAVLGWRYLGRVSRDVIRHVRSKIFGLELHPMPGDVEEFQLVDWRKVANNMAQWISGETHAARDDPPADIVAAAIPGDEFFTRRGPVTDHQALAELARNIARGEIDKALADIADRVAALERATERAALPTEAPGVFKPDAVRPGQRWRYDNDDPITILWVAAGSAFTSDGVAYGTTRLLNPAGPWILVADTPDRVWTIESYEPTTRERRTIAKLDLR